MFFVKLRCLLSRRSFSTAASFLNNRSTNGKPGKYVFLFPGQGAQFVGMCKDMAGSEVRRIFERAERVLGYDLLKLCHEGPQEKLNETIHCQPAVFVASLASLSQLKKDRPETTNVFPEDCCAAGFSLGEIAALVHADSLTESDGMYLVQERAECMQKASTDTPSGMISVSGLEDRQVQQICYEAQAACPGSAAVIANHLHSTGFVISGTLDVIDFVEKHGVNKYCARAVKRLNVGGAFHSPIMKPAQKYFEDVLSKIQISKPQMMVYCNVTGQPYTSVDEIKSNLSRQLVEPVYWHSLMQNVLNNNCGQTAKFFEVGPGQQLKVILSCINRASLRRYHNVKC